MTGGDKRSVQIQSVSVVLCGIFLECSLRSAYQLRNTITHAGSISCTSIGAATHTCICQDDIYLHVGRGTLEEEHMSEHQKALKHAPQPQPMVGSHAAVNSIDSPSTLKMQYTTIFTALAIVQVSAAYSCSPTETVSTLLPAITFIQALTIVHFLQYRSSALFFR